MIANFKTVSRLLGSYDDLCDTIEIQVPNKKVDLDQMVEKIEADNRACFLSAYSMENNVDAKSEMKPLILIMSSFFIVLLLMIYFVISNIANTIIAERIPVIGTFRSIGATQSMMYLLLIGENALYGLIAGIIGAWTGSKAFSAIMDLIEKIFANFDSGISGLSFDLTTKIVTRQWVIVAIILATIAFQILFSLWAIFSIRKISVKNLIFNKQDTSYVHSAVKLRLGVVLLICGIIIYFISMLFRKTALLILASLSLVVFLAGMILLVPGLMRLISYLFGKLADRKSNGVLTLAASNIRNNRMIMRTAVLATATISLTFLMYDYSCSQKEEKVSIPFHADYVMDQGMTFWSSLSYMTNIKGVKTAFPIYMNDMKKAAINGEINEINLMANNDAEDMQTYTDYFQQMDWQQFQNLNDDEAILDEELMKDLKLQIGDTFTLQQQRDKDEDLWQPSVSLKVIGTMDSRNVDDSRNAMIVTRNIFCKVGENARISMALIVTEDGKQQQVGDILKVRTSVKSYEEYVKEKEKSSPIDYILNLLIVIVVFLSFISIFDNQIISFMQRSRQFAVLYSTCTSKHQLKLTILCETALTFVGIILFSMAGSFFMTLPFERILLGAGTTADIDPSTGNIKLAIIIFVIVMLTTASPLKHIKKMKVVEEIKYE